MVWYSHLFQNFPQFIVIHTVKGFGIVKKAKIDVFLELSCFFHDPADVGNLISGSSDFSKSSLNIWKFTVYVLPMMILTTGFIYYNFYVTSCHDFSRDSGKKASFLSSHCSKKYASLPQVFLSARGTWLLYGVLP